MEHSRERVWRALEDFGGVYRFSAGVESSPVNPGTPERGVGAERKCHLYDGNYIEERVTDSVEQKLLALDVIGTSMPMKSAHARFDLEETSAGGCDLSVTMEYVVKFGVVGKAIDSLMLERMMTKNFTVLLASLDEYLRTGVVIEKGWQPARAA
jgi:hypothetical protein